MLGCCNERRNNERRQLCPTGGVCLALSGSSAARQLERPAAGKPPVARGKRWAMCSVDQWASGVHFPGAPRLMGPSVSALRHSALCSALPSLSLLISRPEDFAPRLSLSAASYASTTSQSLCDHFSLVGGDFISHTHTWPILAWRLCIK